MIAMVRPMADEAPIATLKSGSNGIRQTIKVHIPGALRDCCGGASELTVSATTVQSVLDQLERRHPALYRSVCDETGAIRRHVNVFVNDLHMRDCAGLGTVLQKGDTVTILPAVSGG
jgi:sulfur-carrier protein